MMITFSQQADSTDILKAAMKMYFSFQAHFPFYIFPELWQQRSGFW